MKKILLAISLFSSFAFGATTVPVQLLTPTGSTSGQAVLSTGPTTAPTWGSVSATSLSGTLGIANGGTNATTAPAALTNLGAAPTASPTFTGTVTSAALNATTLSASGNDALFYQNTSAQSIPNNTTTTVTTWTKVFDRVNTNFNASTGTFTAPATGIYRVDMALDYANTAAGTVGSAYSCAVNANGTIVAQGVFRQEAAVITDRYCQVHTIVSLTSGQTVIFQAFQNSGAAVPISATGNSNYIAINRVP